MNKTFVCWAVLLTAFGAIFRAECAGSAVDGIRPELAISNMDPKPVSVWPTLGGDQPDRPSVQVFRPEGHPTNCVAVLVFPGGGYKMLCDSYEGKLVAKWLAKRGIVGVVVRYRTAPCKHPDELNDARRAYRFVREHAAEYGVDPKRIGVIGFSAGAHLAGMLLTSPDAGDAKSEDAVQRQPIDVAFGALIYPVVTMQDKFVHKGSRKNLLGENPSQELKDELSLELRVNKTTPSLFVAHSQKDNAVSVENSRLLVAAMKEAGCPVEYLELPEGAHGLGSGRGPEWEKWMNAYDEWLKGL